VNTREFTTDEVLEYLIRKQIDGPLEAMNAILCRKIQAEDFAAMDLKIESMYKGWVQMNGNIRKLGRVNP